MKTDSPEIAKCMSGLRIYNKFYSSHQIHRRKTKSACAASDILIAGNAIQDQRIVIVHRMHRK